MGESEKIKILISVDPEFADMLYDMKKELYGRKKGAQSKTIEDALVALAQQERFEKALEKISEARKEIALIKEEVENEE